MSKPIILVGGFIEVIELCEENNVKLHGVFDSPNASLHVSHKILGNDDYAINNTDLHKNFPLLITPDLPIVRKKLKELYTQNGYNDFYTLVSNQSKISKSSKIGLGTIVQYGVNISSSVTIGDFVKLNTLCNIMHDVTIGDYTTIAPNVVVLGNVTISSEVYIGANATILPNVFIAKGVTVGAGAVVTKDLLKENTIYKGIPAS